MTKQADDDGSVEGLKAIPTPLQTWLATVGRNLMDLRCPLALLLTLSLLYPPWASSAGGNKVAIGLHSLFSSPAGHVDLSRLFLVWLLIVALAVLLDLSIPPKCRGLDYRHHPSQTPLPLLAASLAIAAVLCLIVFGRTALMALDTHLEALVQVAVRLVIVSRVLPWLVNTHRSLGGAYLCFLIANFGWDLYGFRNDLARSLLGLVILYPLVGDFLYRHDVRGFRPAPAAGPAVPQDIEPSPQDQPTADSASPVSLEPVVLEKTIDRFRPPGTSEPESGQEPTRELHQASVGA